PDPRARAEKAGPLIRRLELRARRPGSAAPEPAIGFRVDPDAQSLRCAVAPAPLAEQPGALCFDLGQLLICELLPFEDALEPRGTGSPAHGGGAGARPRPLAERGFRHTTPGGRGASARDMSAGHGIVRLRRKSYYLA